MRCTSCSPPAASCLEPGRPIPSWPTFGTCSLGTRRSSQAVATIRSAYGDLASRVSGGVLEEGLAQSGRAAKPPVLPQVKEQLLVDERQVLRLLAYEVVTEQPHKLLLNFAAVMSASRAAVRLATCLLNDCLVYSDLAVRSGAAGMAAACLAHATGTGGALPAVVRATPLRSQTRQPASSQT